MTLAAQFENDMFELSFFIDFNQNEKDFYNNLYLPEFNLVLKEKIPTNDSSPQSIKIEKFDLAKYTYLLDY
ncbi:MAG: hypothetical protein BAJALOKI3v1_570011 [Promethearchaeota archaeon]|jgi:hypothetical protein|nr:MAG: hypothetical protein BAJALOKI3v1_570011 [Candidatus Lokiarchaeota archaeon]